MTDRYSGSIYRMLNGLHDSCYINSTDGNKEGSSHTTGYNRIVSYKQSIWVGCHMIL